MNKEHFDAMKHGTLILVQNFTTPRGAYRLSYYKHKGEVFMFKIRDGELLEAVNLNKKRGLPVE